MADRQATGAPSAHDGLGDGDPSASTNGRANGSTNHRVDADSSAPTATLTADPPVDDTSGGDETAKKRRRPSKRTLITIGIVVLLLLVAGGTAFFIESSKYVSTDNAQVDGDQLQINAPATGTLTGWRATQGSVIKENMSVGRIELPGSGARVQQIIRAPGNGTVAVNNAVEGMWVTAGTNLATAYNGGGIYTTARVDETDVQDVHVGAPVDIEVDAFPNAHVTGVVSEVQDSAAGVFSLFPESNSSGNFQKVTQVIPVKIAFTNTDGVPLSPGMNVTVKIHKHA